MAGKNPKILLDYQIVKYQHMLQGGLIKIENSDIHTVLGIFTQIRNEMTILEWVYGLYKGRDGARKSIYMTNI